MKLVRVFPVVVAILAFTGCTGSVEQSKAFKDLAKQLKDLAAKQSQMNGKLEDLGLDVNTLMEDVSALQARAQRAGVSPEVQKQVAEATDRLAKLEERIAALQKAKGISAAARTEEKAGAAGTAEPAPAKKAVAKTATKAASGAVRTARAARVEEKSSAPRGFYYKVRSGDTLSGVARRFGVSAQDLARANHLPLDRPLIAGQMIYVKK